MHTVYVMNVPGWILAYSLGGCAVPDDDPLECPAEDERYVPTGANVDTAEECPEGTCALFCTSLICDLEGRYTDYFCEPCDALDAFAAGACEGCRPYDRRGGVEFICAPVD